MSKQPSDLARNKSNVGAASELKVGADLIMKGYHVFRSQSPTAPCDFLIMNSEGIISKVEVRTGRLATDGHILANENGNYDVLAIVIKNSGAIHYRWKKFQLPVGNFK